VVLDLKSAPGVGFPKLRNDELHQMESVAKTKDPAQGAEGFYDALDFFGGKQNRRFDSNRPFCIQGRRYPDPVCMKKVCGKEIAQVALGCQKTEKIAAAFPQIMKFDSEKKAAPVDFGKMGIPFTHVLAICRK